MNIFPHLYTHLCGCYRFADGLYSDGFGQRRPRNSPRNPKHAVKFGYYPTGRNRR